MSMAKICSDDKALAEAIEHGVAWTVIRASVVLQHPELPGLIQASKNAPGNLHEEETQVQLMMRMSLLSQKCLLECGAPNWAHVHKETAKTSSKHCENLLIFQKFIQRWGGGAKAYHIRELLNFWSTHVQAGRMLNPKLLQSLAELRLEANELCPRLVLAIVKADATCATQYVSGGVCELITTADVAGLEKTPSARNAAESLLKHSRELLLKHGSALASATQLKVLCDFDIRVARVAVGRAMADFMTFEAGLANVAHSV